MILGYAAEERIEKGRWVHIDCTVVASQIHAPSDSSLLVDIIRVLNRILAQLQTAVGASGRAPLPYRNHHRAAKRRLEAIQYGRRRGLRRQAYKELLRHTRQTLVAARAAIGWIEAHGSSLGPQALALSGQLAHYGQLTARIIAQTEKRVLRGEMVAAEKVVAIFEEHTDIIVKDRRDTFYGHKVCLTNGRSNLILDGVVVAGNPADVSLTEMMLDRQNSLYGRYPLKAALDGGFAS